jgi:hypothetical protein
MAVDWQFLVVTAIALGAAFVIVRRFMPAPRGAAASPGAPAGAACDHCETGAKATAATPADARTQTTPVVSVRDLRASAKRR